MDPGGSKKIICIFCAGVRKMPDGNWVSTGWENKDFEHSAPGGKLREWGVWYLFKEFPESIILVPGGRGHDVTDDTPDRSDLSEIIKSGLVELGIPATKIITESFSNNTREQLIALAEYRKKTPNFNTVIISNKWHRKRIAAMIENFPELKTLREKTVEIVSAERILLAGDRKKWEKILRAYATHPKMTEIVRLERRGIKDIKSGKYGIAKN